MEICARRVLFQQSKGFLTTTMSDETAFTASDTGPGSLPMRAQRPADWFNRDEVK